MWSSQYHTHNLEQSNDHPELSYEVILDDYIKHSILNKPGQYDNYINLRNMRDVTGRSENSSEMGTGKTREAISTMLWEIYTNDNFKSILIVTPKSVIKSWPGNSLSVRNSMKTYGLGGSETYTESGINYVRRVDGKYDKDYYDIVQCMELLHGAITYVTGKNVTSRGFNIRGKTITVTFVTNQSITDIGFAYIPSEQDIIDIMVNGQYAVTEENVYKIQQSGHSEPNIESANRILQEVNYLTSRKSYQSSLGYNSNVIELDKINSPNINNFVTGNRYVRGSGSKQVIEYFNRPNSTLCVFDEYYRVIKQSNMAYYTMYFVNYQLSIGNKVITISGTAIDDYVQFSNYLSLNGFFIPVNGLVIKNPETSKMVYNKIGIDTIINYMMSCYDINNLEYSYSRDLFNLNSDDIPGVINFANWLLTLDTQNYEYNTAIHVMYYYLKYMKRCIGDSVVVENPDEHFSRKRNINRFLSYTYSDFMDEKLQEAIASLKPDEAKNSSGGGVVTNVSRGLEIGLIFPIIHRVLEILKNGENKYKEYINRNDLTAEELSYKGNRVILYFDYIESIIFTKCALLILSKYYLDEPIKSDEIFTYHSSTKYNNINYNSNKQEDVIHAANNSIAKVIILTYKSGAEGMSLNEKLDEFGYEPHVTYEILPQSYSFNLISQAMSRSIRMGIVRNVEVELFVNHNVIFKRMISRHWFTSISKIQPEIMATYGLFKRNEIPVCDLLPEQIAAISGPEANEIEIVNYMNDIFTPYQIIGGSNYANHMIGNEISFSILYDRENMSFVIYNSLVRIFSGRETKSDKSQSSAFSIEINMLHNLINTK